MGDAVEILRLRGFDSAGLTICQISSIPSSSLIVTLRPITTMSATPLFSTTRP